MSWSYHSSTLEPPPSGRTSKRFQGAEQLAPLPAAAASFPWSSTASVAPPPRSLEAMALSPRFASVPGAKLPFDGPLSPRTSPPPQPPPPPPRRPVKAPQGYAHPANRADVLSLSMRLQDGLARGGSVEQIEALWRSVELELIRQVYVACSERGELLDAVRAQNEIRLANLRRSVAAQRAELQRLRKEVGVLGSVALADEQGGGGGGGGGGGPSSSVANESDAQRRVRLLSDAVRGLPAADQQEAVRRLATRAGADGRRELLRALVEGAGPGEPVGLFAGELEALDLVDATQLLSRVFHHAKLDEQIKILHVLSSELDAEQRVQLAVDVAAPTSAETRATLAQQLVGGLGPVARQGAVAALIEGLPREERALVMEKVVEALPAADFKRIFADHSAALPAEQRRALLAEMLGSASRAEREQLVQEQLVAMSAEERLQLLRALLGTMVQGERVALLDHVAAMMG